MGTLSIAQRIRYAIRDFIAPPLCALRGHRWERIPMAVGHATLCTRCGEPG